MHAGKENGNYYSGLYRVQALGSYQGLGIKGLGLKALGIV